MSRGKPGGGDTGPASAATAEKNELGFIIFAYNIGYQTDETQLHNLFQPYGTVAKVGTTALVMTFNVFLQVLEVRRVCFLHTFVMFSLRICIFFHIFNV